MSPKRCVPALLLALSLAACGQLPAVHQEGRTVVLADGVVAGDTGAVVVDGGAVPGDAGIATGDETASGSPGSGTTPDPAQDGAASGGATAPEGGAAAAPESGGGRRQVRGSDRTGVTDTTIRFGSHAPVTGAAPLPSRSFEQAADLYWRWITQVKDQTVLGRTNIELVFADDRYQPSTAIQVCRELAQSTFMVSGAGGTDQIQACGRYANGAKVPYFSAGVTENGLRGLPWYFAFSMTYSQQGKLLAQYVKKNFAGKKVAAVLTDTPNFDDAVQGWEQGVQAQGLDYLRTFRHPKGDTSWYNTVARELANGGAEVVYINTSPVDYIRFVQQANQQGYRPQFVGVGITMGLNAVLGGGCPDVDGGIFFSPFPGLDWARRNVPEFFEASQRFGTPVDDLAMAIWGSAQSTHELLKGYGQVYGNDLTREDFRDFAETFGGQPKVFPRAQFTPQDHFGGKQVHVLKANCAKGEHETLATFATGF